MSERNLEALKEGEYQIAGLTKFKLSCPLDFFPSEIFTLGDTLQHLDLTGTGLSSLPSDFGSRLPHLKVAFFSNCNFTTFPSVLASCPALEMVAFRGNAMRSIPESTFPSRLRWLILTDNQISALPSSIGNCTRLQKCMLAGNHLTSLPSSMSQCTSLGLLRLSANRFSSLPDWLFTLPSLAFLSFAGNPCVTTTSDDHSAPGLSQIPWSSLIVQQTLGQGASGIISAAEWQQSPTYAEPVAIKLFRGALTSDGTPHDEMQTCLAAGAHENLIGVLGRIVGHPDEVTHGGGFQGGIVMHLIPPEYSVLGQPPSLQSCTRDCYEEGQRLDRRTALGVLRGVAGAGAHLHARGISHGDLYAHNVLMNREDGHALLGDYGAATIYGDADNGKDEHKYAGIEKLEVLAFAHLVEDVMGLLREDFAGEVDEEELSVEELKSRLADLHARCALSDPRKRPAFSEVEEELQKLVGWRNIMRLPTSRALLPAGHDELPN